MDREKGNGIVNGVDPTKLCQIEIHVSNIERSLKFYETVMNWPAVPTEIHNYHVLEVPERCPFGIALVPDKKAIARSGIVLYFAVDDPQEIANAAKLQGTDPLPGATLPGYGKVQQIQDPDGNCFGLYKKA